MQKGPAIRRPLLFQNNLLLILEVHRQLATEGVRCKNILATNWQLVEQAKLRFCNHLLVDFKGIPVQLEDHVVHVPFFQAVCAVDNVVVKAIGLEDQAVAVVLGIFIRSLEREALP